MLSLETILRFSAFLGIFGYLMQICIFFILYRILQVLKKHGVDL